MARKQFVKIWILMQKLLVYCECIDFKNTIHKEDKRAKNYFIQKSPQKTVIKINIKPKKLEIQGELSKPQS